MQNLIFGIGLLVGSAFLLSACVIFRPEIQKYILKMSSHRPKPWDVYVQYYKKPNSYITDVNQIILIYPEEFDTGELTGKWWATWDIIRPINEAYPTFTIDIIEENWEYAGFQRPIKNRGI